MGCDYYIVEQLYVKLKDKNFIGNNISFTVEISRAPVYSDFKYDSDSENDYNIKEKEYERKLNESCVEKNKMLYENDEWLISSNSKKNDIIESIKDDYIETIEYYYGNKLANELKINELNMDKIDTIKRTFYVMDR